MTCDSGASESKPGLKKKKNFHGQKRREEKAPGGEAAVLSD